MVAGLFFSIGRDRLWNLGMTGRPRRPYFPTFHFPGEFTFSGQNLSFLQPRPIQRRPGINEGKFITCLYVAVLPPNKYFLLLPLEVAHSENLSRDDCPWNGLFFDEFRERSMNSIFGVHMRMKVSRTYCWLWTFLHCIICKYIRMEYSD